MNNDNRASHELAPTCASCAEHLAAFDEHLLASAERDIVVNHLESCPACRNRLAELHHLRARLEQAGGAFRASTADAVMARIREARAGSNVEAAAAPRHAHRRRFMMPRVARYAAAIAACTAIVSTGFFLWPSSAPGVAFAGVISKARDAKSVRFRITQEIDGVPIDGRVMMLRDSRLRVETSDGRVSIGDLATGQHLILNTKARTCARDSTSDTSHMFNPYQILISLKDHVAEDLGVEMYDGRPARVFRASMPGEMKRFHGDSRLTVWADLQTSLPLRIEIQHTAPDADGKGEMLMIVDQLDFGSMDEKLFSLDPPAGYTLGAHEVVPEAGGMDISRNVRTMLMACSIYQQEHNAWPAALTDLQPYGVTDEMLKNPRRPDQAIGYVYIKPGAGTQPDDLMIFENLKPPQDWIAVGFWDGHTEILNDAAHFHMLLGRAMDRSKQSPGTEPSQPAGLHGGVK